MSFCQSPSYHATDRFGEMQPFNTDLARCLSGAVSEQSGHPNSRVMPQGNLIHRVPLWSKWRLSWYCCKIIQSGLLGPPLEFAGSSIGEMHTKGVVGGETDQPHYLSSWAPGMEPDSFTLRGAGLRGWKIHNCHALHSAVCCAPLVRLERQNGEIDTAWPESYPPPSDLI